MTVNNPNLQFRANLTPLVPANVRYGVTHHIAGSNRTVEQIHNQHLGLSWLGIGYNEYIRKDGSVWIGRGDNVGAQTQGFNTVSYGIGFEGNYDVAGTIMPEAQFKAGVARWAYHLSRFPNMTLKRHRDLNPTACPGRFFPFERMMAEVEQLMYQAPDDYVPDEAHWAAEYKQFLIENGITIHEERFDDNITRGEVFALLGRLYRAINTPYI